MEAATATGSGLLPRDGSIPATASISTSPDGAREAIDGVVRCACCDRFPLLGELVIRHEGPQGRRGRKPSNGGWVCACCERSGRGEPLGAVAGSSRVRSLGGAMNVRRVR